jgi:hypothetical protein
MMKMPADIPFQIGMNDALGHEKYVEFPANTTAYGLTRDGNWGRAIVPISEFASTLDLTQINYVFMIRNTTGEQGQFAIDDIYLDGGQTSVSSLRLDADSYTTDATSASATVRDETAAGTTVLLTVNNGSETIDVTAALDATGTGTATIHFGTTNDDTDTIALIAGQTLTITYTDGSGHVRTDTANITAGTPTVATFGVFTDNTPVTEGITPGLDAQIYVWENTLTAATIPPYEGDNVIAWQTTGMSWFGGGIMANASTDLSAYAGGTLQFMIKMPANVTFKIGVTDAADHENYVSFPANTTVFGLERNGEWGRATIPLSTLITSVNLATVQYVFTIVGEDGSQCEFAIDDIYWQAAEQGLRFPAGNQSLVNR